MPSVFGTVGVDLPEDDLGPLLFLRASEARADVCLVQHCLKQAVDEDVLPERARVVRLVEYGKRRDTLVEVDDVLVMLRQWRSDADVWLAAAATPDARSVLAEIEARVPKTSAPDRVPVQFSDAHTGTRTLSLSTRPWDAVRDLYPDDVQAALDALVGHVPVEQEARRLLLWHGAPGTGKTTAVRALLHAWQEWADPLVVSDPERLLSEGKYLRRVLLDVEDEDKWQLIVLEDAEALLQTGKASTAALSKLLNLADGLLGQGLRCLFLLTTNQSLGAVHPALVRPGRCLATVEFGPLPAARAAALLSRPVDRDMTLAEVLALRPVTVEAQPVRVGQYL